MSDGTRTVDRTWMRWYDHLPRRLYMLRWFLLHGWRPTRLGIRGQMLRHAYWVLVRGYAYEICHRCGRPVRIVFHVPDAIWTLVAGTSRSPGGEAGGGVLCPVCVDELYTLAVPRGDAGYLRWTCRADDSVMIAGNAHQRLLTLLEAHRREFKGTAKEMVGYHGGTVDEMLDDFEREHLAAAEIGR